MVRRLFVLEDKNRNVECLKEIFDDFGVNGNLTQTGLFMGSPKYDEIVDMVRSSNGDGAH